LRALQRRQTILRILESGGFALAAGCIVLLPILAGVIWKHRSPASLPLLILITCSLIGMIWGWSRRPSLFAVAVEADRQLDFKELLATSLNCENYDCAFAATLRREAEIRAANLRSSQVHLAQVGLSSWSGIGLLLALIVSLDFVADSNSRRRDFALNDSVHSTEQSTASTRDRPLVDLSLDTGRRARVEQNPEDLDGSKFGQNSGSKDNAATTRESAAIGDHPRTNQSSSAGSGSGMSRSEQANTNSASAPDLPVSVPSNSANATGQTASGTAGPSRLGTPDGARPGTGGAVTTPRANDAAYWHSDAWRSQADHARQTLKNGQIPPLYRDLVREYFR